MIFCHHKGGLYRLLFEAFESTNGRERRPVVVYVSLKNGSINVRDAVEFYGEVSVLDSDGQPLTDAVDPAVPRRVRRFAPVTEVVDGWKAT